MRRSIRHAIILLMAKLWDLLALCCLAAFVTFPLRQTLHSYQEVGRFPRRGVMKRLQVAVLPLMILGLWGCGSGPAGSEPTTPKASKTETDLIAFQQGDLVVGEVVFACNRWLETAPSDDPIVVNFFFARESAMDPITGPTDAHKTAVRNAGGKILYSFHVPAVRAELPRAAVRELYLQYLLSHAQAVPRHDRFDLGVSVGFRGDGSALMQRFEELGGYIDNVYTTIPAFHGFISDAALPELRAHDEVLYLEDEGIGCLD